MPSWVILLLFLDNPLAQANKVNLCTEFLQKDFSGKTLAQYGQLWNLMPNGKIKIKNPLPKKVKYSKEQGNVHHFESKLNFLRQDQLLDLVLDSSGRIDSLKIKDPNEKTELEVKFIFQGNTCFPLFSRIRHMGMTYIDNYFEHHLELCLKVKKLNENKNITGQQKKDEFDLFQRQLIPSGPHFPISSIRPQTTLDRVLNLCTSQPSLQKALAKYQPQEMLDGEKNSALNKNGEKKSSKAKAD